MFAADMLPRAYMAAGAASGAAYDHTVASADGTRDFDFEDSAYSSDASNDSQPVSSPLAPIMSPAEQQLLTFFETLRRFRGNATLTGPHDAARVRAHVPAPCFTMAGAAGVSGDSTGQQTCATATATATATTVGGTTTAATVGAAMRRASSTAARPPPFCVMSYTRPATEQERDDGSETTLCIDYAETADDARARFAEVVRTAHRDGIRRLEVSFNY